MTRSGLERVAPLNTGEDPKLLNTTWHPACGFSCVAPAVLARQHLLQPAQRHRLASADHAAQRDQVAVIDRLLDILEQLTVMGSLVVADGARRACQTIKFHHLSAHARRPLLAAAHDRGNSPARR